MKKYLPYVLAFGLGVVLSGRVRSIPGLNKLPAF